MSSFYGNISIGNAEQYAQQASVSAAAAQASAVSANASAIQAAQSAQSVDAPELTRKILSAFPVESASGTIVTFGDGADNIPVKKLKVTLKPHQTSSGDPSPDNVRPISGYTDVTVTRAGKNIGLLNFDSFVNAGITYTRNANGSVTANGTSTSTSAGKNMSYLYLPNGNYIIGGGCPNIGVRANLYNAENSVLSRITSRGEDKPFVVDDTVDHVGFACGYVAVDTTVNETFYPMLREASFTDDMFEPYTADTYTITIPTSAGTVYGGTLTVDQGGSGTLTVGWGSVDLGTLTWYKNNGDNLYFYATVAGKARGLTNVMSDRFVTVSRSEWGSYSDAISGRDTSSQVYIKSSQYSSQTAAGFKASVSGVNIVYELENPTTYNLTAEQVTTLLGDNTVWMDADGTIDLEYRVDTQKYINDRIALLNANLAFIEEGTTASRAYSVGQYVNIKGQLYKVTASIASGATFTVGTNVVSTTVGTELTALN